MKPHLIKENFNFFIDHQAEKRKRLKSHLSNGLICTFLFTALTFPIDSLWGAKPALVSSIKTATVMSCKPDLTTVACTTREVQFEHFP